MKSIWTMGEMLVEIMRPRPDMDHQTMGEYVGPFPSGAPAIFIDTVARLGLPSGIIGGVGDDGFGRALMDRLETDHVDCRYVLKSKDRSTAVAFVMYRSDGSREFIFHMEGTSATCASSPEVSKIESPGFFHIMGSSLAAAEGFRTNILKTMSDFIRVGAKVSFDPNIRLELLHGKDILEMIGPVMENCAILCPGVEELFMVSDRTTVEEAVDRLFCNPVLEVIALKKGKKGCTVYTRKEHFDVAAYRIEPVDPVDPTGAGDCFDAAFLCGILENRDLQDCARRATAAGTINAATLGPMEGRISPEMIERVIKYNGYIND